MTPNPRGSAEGMETDVLTSFQGGNKYLARVTSHEKMPT
jgi:hypothetical protein